ncbi:hypothetical protein EB118_25285, partial [bacterium]|nr:hypothetical protein [bacterium]
GGLTITGATSLAATTISGSLSATGAGTGLSVTNNATIGGGLSIDTAGAGAYGLYVGNDSYFADVNVANTIGLYGASNSAIGAIKFGSGGPTIGANGANLTLNGAALTSANVFASYSSGTSINTTNTTGVSNTNACRATGVDGFGAYQLGFCTSLQKYKDNTQNLSLGLSTLRQLRPVEFDWNLGPARHDLGFIAEEVYAVNPLLAEYANGELTGVAYNLMSVLNTKAIQQLDVQVQNIDRRLVAIESGEFEGNLTVAGDSLFSGNLKVEGTTELASLKVTGNTELATLTVERIISKGELPTAVLGASTGLNGVVVVDGNDTAGTISYTAGTPSLPANPLAAGEQVTLTFDKPYTAAPRVSLTPTSADAANVRYYVTQTATDFKVVFTDVPSSGASYSFNYQIIQ